VGVGVGVLVAIHWSQAAWPKPVDQLLVTRTKASRASATQPKKTLLPL